MSKRVLLKYSTEKAGEPIIASAIREIDVPLNILHADLTEKGGEILISIDASEDETQKMVKFFEDEGVEVETIKRVIDLSDSKCIDCGACVSLCPTGAIYIAEDSSIELEEEKCVYCKACIPACPVEALKVREL